ncbi:MAG: hypothetical protein V2A54_15750 [Bacteroidota bacterium]
MRIARYALILTVMILAGKSAFTQPIKVFSENPIMFFDDMKKFMTEDDKKKGGDLMEKFEPAWNSGKFSDDKKKKIISISNQMLKKKLKAFPHFNAYLEDLILFTTSSQNPESFNSWMTSLEKLMLRSTSTKFVSYLDMTNSLLSKNAIYHSVTTEWIAGSKAYTFEFDTVPKVVFAAPMNLKCVVKDDSAVIYGTKGTYYPTENIWIGQAGTVNWKKAGIGKDTVWAELKIYKITMKSNNYVADSVVFYNKNFFAKPLMGKLQDKVIDAEGDRATYPRFESYLKRIPIPNVFPGVDYEGGFEMHGAKLYGVGDKNNKAFVTFKRDGKLFLRTVALSYLIRKDRISSEQASITVYWESDSIYHPGLSFKYMNEKKEVSLMRGDQGVSISPFFDSFHKIDIYCEALYWKTSDPKMDFTMVKGVGSESEAFFESASFYNENRYNTIQGIDQIHPLQQLKQYSDKVKSRTFPVAKYAAYITITVDQTKALMINLAAMGFLHYNSDAESITLKDKAFHYLNAKDRRTDYDVINFRSVVKSQNNATLSLLNFDLAIQGVDLIKLSDSHNVFIQPVDKKILLKKNRDFDFSGRIFAGLCEFYGKDFNFIYDNFKINMNNVDSFLFKVKPFKATEKGDEKLVRVKTIVEGIIGDIVIDKPANKSGLKYFPEYPIFNSKKESYAYYDKRCIFPGVYNRENFFFQLDPFLLDSLDEFKTEGVHFSGYFASAGIFPDIQDALSVQPDYSLGFIKKTPEAGLPNYGGKGTYFNRINLSNNGLRGDGELKYLTSITKSHDFLFFPDSMNTYAYSYEVKPKEGSPEYPDVKAEDVYIHWLPQDNLMSIFKREKPFDFYAGQTKMHGRLDLTPNYLAGNGRMEFPNADIESKKFVYKKTVFDADTSDFKMKSYDLSQLSLITLNYKAHIDMKERKGEFKSNDEMSRIEFPINQYIAFMDMFTWYMDKEEIDLSSTKQNLVVNNNPGTTDYSDLNLQGSKFVSIHPAQDSLRFYAPVAKYSIKNNIIYAKDVKFINVADAAIIPQDGVITVLKHAEMETLENAKIVANTATQFHNFYDATVNIYGRKKFLASGSCDFIDENKKVQGVFFEKITADSSAQTYATANIDEPKHFMLSPNFEFYGGTRIIASQKNWTFNGNARIVHGCADLRKSFIQFKASIDQNEIYIPIAQSIKDPLNGALFAGMSHSRDSGLIYTSFLARKLAASDDDLFSAFGFLYFDKSAKEYRIADTARIKGNKIVGNYLSLNSYCDAYGEGKLTIDSDLGQVKMSSWGNILNKTKTQKSKLDLLMSIDFFFSEKCWKIIEDGFAADMTSPAVDMNRDTYTRSLALILGQEAADKYMSEVGMSGKVKRLPEAFEHNLFLTQVAMNWNAETQSFVSEGLIGIGNVNKVQLNRQVNGYVELQKKRGGDVLNIYLEDDAKNWYFFSYKNNVMMVITSNTDINTIIKDMKPDDRRLNVDKGKPYAYTLGTDKSKKDFLIRMGAEPK